MWTRFNPATKKKSTRGASGSRTKRELTDIQAVESNIDKSVIKIFADNCAELHEYLEKCWNTDLNDGEIQDIPVAIVNCSFSHVYYFRKALQSNTKNVVISIRSDSPFKVTVEKMKHSKPSVFLIEQFESLPVEYVENLFSLVKWFSLRHSFILCVSTGIDAFLESCSLPILRCVNTAFFNMPEPVSLLEVIMKNVFETTIANNFYLSSEVISLLRLRYLYNSFSLDELKKTLRLCIQHNLWMSLSDSALEEEHDFEENIKKYMENLKFYCLAMDLPMYKCHEEIQAEAYDPIRGPIKLNILREWVQQKCVGEAMRTKMKECLSAYDSTRKNPQTEKTSSISAAPKQRMSALEFRQLAEANRSAYLKEKTTNPDIVFQNAFNEIFRNLLCSWNNFPSSHVHLIKPGPENNLYCNPANIVEVALIDEDNKKAPLAVAYKTLQKRVNWKSIRVVDWLKYYKDELAVDEYPISFHAALAQLESMGVIKTNNEKSKGTLMVIHHPATHTIN